MNRILKQILFGALVWLIPFLFSFLVWPLHTSMLSLFKTIMIICLTITVVFFIIIYFKKESSNYFMDGIILGIIWFVINIIFDLIVIVVLFKTPIVDYFIETGLRYLMMPIMSFGFGYILSKK